MDIKCDMCGDPDSCFYYRIPSIDLCENCAMAYLNEDAIGNAACVINPKKADGYYNVKIGKENDMEIKMRWNSGLSQDLPYAMKIEAFLDEIEKVCKKHNLSISHEDGHGGFEIEEYNQDNIEWLRDASDYRG